ncbi:hypothetical protein [Streptomyces violascens]
MTHIRITTAVITALVFAVLPTGIAHAEGRAEDQVNAFFSQYRKAMEGPHPRDDALEVRENFMTTGLNCTLDEWATQHGADPVFRAQNVPDSWSAAYEGSGMGHSTVILTEYWKNGGHTDVWYQIRLRDLAIDGLEDAPS